MIGAEQRLQRRPSNAPIRPQDIVGQAIQEQQGQLLQNLLSDPTISKSARIQGMPLEPLGGLGAYAPEGPTRLSSPQVPAGNIDNLRPNVGPQQVLGGVGIVAALLGALTGNEVIAAGGAGLAGGASNEILRAVSKFDADNESYQEGVRRLNELAAQNEAATERIFLQNDLASERQAEQVQFRQLAAEAEADAVLQRQLELEKFKRTADPTYQEVTNRINANKKPGAASGKAEKVVETDLQKEIRVRSDGVDRLLEKMDLMQRQEKDTSDIEIELAQKRKLLADRHLDQIVVEAIPDVNPKEPGEADLIKVFKAVAEGKLPIGLYMALAVRGHDAGKISDELFNGIVARLSPR